jgi:hypothetical protein
MAHHTSNIQKTENDNRIRGGIGVEGVGNKGTHTLKEGFEWMAHIGIDKCGIYFLMMGLVKSIE